MKHTLILLVIGLLLVTGLHGEMKFSFKATGGLAYIANSNWNDGITGWNSYYVATYAKETGAFDTLHTGLNFGGELIMNFDKNFGIGLGGSYFSMSANNTITFSVLSINLQWQPKAAVIPILLNLHYTTPIGKSLNFTASAGGGYYMGKFTFNSALTQVALSTNEVETYSATKGAIGFQGSVGLEMELSKGIFITLDVNGRVASMSEITGDYTYNGTIFGVTQPTLSETRTLWYMQYKAPNNATYNIVALAKNQPTQSYYSGVTKAAIDLTGFAATLGVRIVF